MYVCFGEWGGLALSEKRLFALEEGTHPAPRAQPGTPGVIMGTLLCASLGS